MIKYRIEKLTMAVLAASLFFSARAFFWMAGMLNNEFFEGAPESEIFMFALRDGGYFGDLDQMLVGTIILVLAVEYVAAKNDAIYLIRYTRRSPYVSRQLCEVVYTCLGVTLCKFCIAFIVLFFSFDSELVFSAMSVKRLISGFLLFSVYAVRCGIVYMIIRDLLNKRNLAMGITVLIYFLEFYIWLDNLLGIAMTLKWMPFRDMTASMDYAIGQISGLGLSITMIRQLGLTVIAMLIWYGIWRRKDVMDIEK